MSKRLQVIASVNRDLKELKDTRRNTNSNPMQIIDLEATITFLQRMTDREYRALLK